MSDDGGVAVAVLDVEVSKPSRSSLAWYVGLGAMVALEVIEWPLALLVGASHALATHSRSDGVKQFADGAGSAA